MWGFLTMRSQLPLIPSSTETYGIARQFLTWTWYEQRLLSSLITQKIKFCVLVVTRAILVWRQALKHKSVHWRTFLCRSRRTSKSRKSISKLKYVVPPRFRREVWEGDAGIFWNCSQHFCCSHGDTWNATGDWISSGASIQMPTLVLKNSFLVY